MSKSFVVVGGGITGVTTAYSLAKSGFDVTLIEKNRYPGMATGWPKPVSVLG
jgi:D-amino-acid dehydrogenase